MSLRDAGRGRLGTSAENRDIHVRVPFPVDRPLLWVPRRGPPPNPPTSDGPYELVFQRDVLGRMARHATGDPEASRFGFLLGRLHRCPTSGVHYALVDRVLPAGEEFVEEAPGAYLLRAWADAQAEFRRHPGVLVGWYHSHRLLGLLLSEGDMDANRRYFNEAWQCCVLFVPDEARPLGSVFRPGIQESESHITRSCRVLGGPVQDESQRPGPPALDWTNYEIQRESFGFPDFRSRTGDHRAASRQTPAPGQSLGECPVRRRDRSRWSFPPSHPTPDPSHRGAEWSSWTTVFAFDRHRRAGGDLAFQGARSDVPPPVTRPTIQRPVRPRFRRISPGSGRLRRSCALRSTGIRNGPGTSISAGSGATCSRRAMALIDESFIQFVAVRSRLDAESGSEPALEFDRLSEEVDDVNGTSMSTGCPRPE